MKKFFVCAEFICLLTLLPSCYSSGRIVVPGEDRVIGQNLTEEYFAIAEQFRTQENYEKALTYYKKVLGNKKLHESAFYQIAVCNVYTKKWDEARDSFRKLLKRDPENINLRKSLAYIESMNGNLKKAEKMYALLISEFESDAELYKNYINVLVALEKYDFAMEQVLVFAENFPDDEKIEVFKTKIKELQEDPKDKNSSSENEKEEKDKTDGEDNGEGENESKDDEDLFGLGDAESNESGDNGKKSDDKSETQESDGSGIN